jgi:hypothetical protein
MKNKNVLYLPTKFICINTATTIVMQYDAIILLLLAAVVKLAGLLN